MICFLLKIASFLVIKFCIFIAAVHCYTVCVCSIIIQNVQMKMKAVNGKGSAGLDQRHVWISGL